MKKILLSCFLAFGIGASAQIYVSESFEAGTPATFAITGGYTGASGVYNITPSSCNGMSAIGGNNYQAAPTASATLNLVYTKPGGMTANGKKIDVSFTVSTQPYGATSTVSGTVNVSYSTDGGTTYLPVGTPLTLTSGVGAGQTCTPYAVTIPETAAVTGNFKLRIQSVSDAASNDFYTFFDKVEVAQEVTAIPVCTSLASPVSGATEVSVRPTLSWPAVENAQTYKVKIGTTAGSEDVLTGESLTNSYTPSSTNVLPASTLLYVRIIPVNTLGEATGCTETTFTTGANVIAPYCGPLSSSAPTNMTPIKSVSLAGTVNDSDLTATTAGSYNPHEFTATAIDVKNDITTMPITVKGTGIGANGFAMSVFIDWNEDGDFDDVGESYFNTTATIKRSTTITGGVITLTGTLPIPAGTALGLKRMRVKYNFSGATLNSTLTTACSDLTNGQAEEYTINYKSSLATSNATKAKLSVYPNPFQDVLKISDMKGVKSISVSDVSGRQVKNLKPSAELNLSDLKTGLYIVTLQMEDGTIQSFKAIKK